MSKIDRAALVALAERVEGTAATQRDFDLGLAPAPMAVQVYRQ